MLEQNDSAPASLVVAATFLLPLHHLIRNSFSTRLKIRATVIRVEDIEDGWKQEEDTL